MSTTYVGSTPRRAGCGHPQRSAGSRSPGRSRAAPPPAVDPVAAFRLDPAQLLHVNVDQLPSHLPLIAAHHPPRGSVQEVQSRQTPPAQPADPRLGRQPPRAGLWPRGSVTEPSSRLCLPPPQQPVHRLPGELRSLSRRRHRPPFQLHPLDQQPPALFRQPRSRSSISHKGPSLFWIQQPQNRGQRAITLSTTSMGTTSRGSAASPATFPGPAVDRRAQLGSGRLAGTRPKPSTLLLGFQLTVRGGN